MGRPGTVVQPPPPAARGFLELERVAAGEAFEPLGDEWDSLVRTMPRPSPFLLHGWLSEWWRHYGGGAELAVHVARRDGRLVGALPLFTSSRRGLRVSRFLGGRSSALADLLLAPGESGDAAELLVRGAAGLPHDFACFSGLPAGSRLAGSLELRLQERVEAPVLDLTEGWEAVYRAKTNSQKRKLHARRGRRLAELGRVELSIARESEGLLRALEEAFAVHERRWRGQPDSSGFATLAGRCFHRAAIARLAPAGVPRIATLRLDGRPIAFQYAFVLSGRLYLHRLAFDPAFSRFSPGIMTMLHLLEEAAGEGLTTVEFLGAGDAYKLELADRLEPLHEGFGLARTPQGWAAVRAELAAIKLRRRLKQNERLRQLYFDGLTPLRRVFSRGRERPAAT